MIEDRIWTLVSRKLSGEATISELTELDSHIKNEANAGLYLQIINEFWKIPVETDEEFLEATYHLHLNRLKTKGFDFEKDEGKDEPSALFPDNLQPSSAKTGRQKIYIAIPLFTIVAFIFFIGYDLQNSTAKPAVDLITQSEVSTKSGSRTKIQLPDGSSVWLNGSSKLVFDNRSFGKKVREVTLTGEGYFDVAKNKVLPFIIHANNVSIKVTGTVLNIKAYPDEKNTETSLIRGSIEVTVKGRKEKIMMKANDKLILSNAETTLQPAGHNMESAAPKDRDLFVAMGHLTLTNDENTVVETAWVENKLIFDKETFEEVALKMERWYGVNIQFKDDKLKLQRITGIFEKETVSEALRALQISTPFFKYKINNQAIIIFK